MADRTRDAVTMDLAAEALRKECTLVAAMHGLHVVAVVATESGYRLAHPKGMTERDASQVLLYVAENEAQELLKRGMRGDAPPVPPLPPGVEPLSTSEQVHVFNETYQQALDAMRRCEHVLLTAGADPNRVIAVRVLADNVDRTRHRHLSALIERQKAQEKPDAT